MKICHMTSAHGNNDTRIFEKECSSLAKSDRNEIYFIVKGETMQRNNVNIIGVGQPPNSRLKRMTLFAKKVYKKALEIDADIYHFHDPELLPYGIKLKKRGKKVIYDSHENYSKQIKIKNYLPKLLASLVAFIFSKYELYAIKKLDAVVSTCIENGVDFFEGKCKRSFIIDNYPILKEKNNRKGLNTRFTLCYMGGLSDSRCLFEMIRATHKTNSRIILAGDLSEENKKIIDSMPEKSCIEYKGYITKEEVYSIYKKCDAGFSLLKKIGQYGVDDNLPTKAYECMMFSLPVIISDDDYAIKLMKKKEFGVIVNPKEIDEIVKAIERLKDPKLNIEMGNNGRNLVEEKFNWSMEEKKLFKVYETIIRDEGCD